jgi:hypothetical protein
MNCQELAARIERLQPAAQPRDVARLCLLMTNHVPDVDALEDEDYLADVWRDLGIRLQAATDQHAAMTEDLERLARSPPDHFTSAEVLVLIRAVRVQSQVLEMYVGPSGEAGRVQSERAGEE